MLKTSNDQRKLLPNFEHLFATTAQAPGGVARLRELILTLAVQGKLVPQDPSDEPASELLKKIRAEKDRLIAEGKIKKDKPLAAITEEEIPFELPVGWEWVPLQYIGYTQTGTTPDKKNSDFYGSYIPFIKPGDIYQNYVDYNNEGLSEIGLYKSGRLAPKGSILMVCIGTIGKSNIIQRDCSFNQQINSITPLLCNPNFVNICLRCPAFQFQAWSRSSSTTIAILNKGKWEEIPIALPPLAEQSRIVARVEELMRLCDALEEKGRLEHTQHQQLLQAMLDSLTQTTNAQELARHWQRLAQHFDLLIDRPEAVDALEQTILQLAVRGLLVEQKENEDPLQINSSKEGRLVHDLNGPFGVNIPKGWRLYSLLELGKITGGKTPSTQNNKYWGGEIPWITPKDMKFEIVEGSLDKVTKEALEDGLTIYPSGSVLMVVRSGILRRIFPVALSKVEFTVNQDLKVLVPDLKISEYLVLMLKGFEREILRDLTKIGTTVESIQFDKFSKFKFPLPPLAEQSRIVARVTELRALCQQLREKLTQARTTQTQLAQAWVEQVATI